MNLKTTALKLTLSAALLSGATLAYADTAPVPGHPRVNEVNQRIDNQQKRIDKGVANGTITPQQQARDEKRLANVSQRASADEAKNGGHLTQGEQTRLNHSLNKNSRHVKAQKQG